MITHAVASIDRRKGPLFRAILIDSLLVTVFDHIVFDGWSVDVFSRDLAHAYFRMRAGCLPSLPALAVQYGDYAVWERRWLASENGEQKIDEWRRMLTPPLPQSLTVQVAPTRSGVASTSFECDPALSADLRSLARACQTTLFAVLTAAFHAIVGALAVTDDVIVGTEVANRTSKPCEQLIGFFANTVLLRLDLSGSPSFVDLVRRAHRVSARCLDLQDVPFLTVARALGPSFLRPAEPRPSIVFQLADIGRAVRGKENGSARFDAQPLSLVGALAHGSERGVPADLWIRVGTSAAGSLLGVARHDRRVLDDALVARAVDGFTALLRLVAANPEATVSTMASFALAIAEEDPT